MISDTELRREVERELEWEPSVDERHIGVAVDDGIVTLTGDVKAYLERWKAERTAERVKGVRGVVNELTVHTSVDRTDTDIAKAAVDALRWNVSLPENSVKVIVRKGHLTLEGEVPWDYQRRAAERAVRSLAGVRGVTNLIRVKPQLQPDRIKERIEETFKREATYDANRIAVEVSGSEVTLRGTVRSWVERHEAEKAAWSAPGVTAVTNLITVDPVLAAA